ncbi:MAG: polysaccharide biosynthesis C-terminal domain-containing protein, partial [Pseudomonadales bacterium]|nr:polysaccharide biosynthesis C-terminal domain-containing protein [Pseudomonadales bacterium]
SLIRYIPELVVDKNKSGIKNLIIRTSRSQLLALLLMLTVLILLTPWLEQVFNTPFNNAILFTCGLIIFELLKTNVAALLTGFFLLKQQAIFSLLQGVCWLVLLFILLNQQMGVNAALLAPSLSYGLIYLLAVCTLYRYINSLNWQDGKSGISGQRLFKHSGSSAVSTLLRLMMLKYTELFFLAMQEDTATVGIYDLAFSIPMLVIVFIPAAVQDLFTSGFSEAYVRDKSCLPALIRTFYKLIILLSVPLAVFGWYFLPAFFQLFYGEEMALAGQLGAWFCLFHLLPLISVPLSMAIQAKEKILNMLPTLVLQLLVNVLLDYVFIVAMGWGVWGAMLAIVLTFVLTIPVRLWLVHRLIGGLYIPLWFFVKIFALCLMLAGLLDQALQMSIELGWSSAGVLSLSVAVCLYILTLLFVLFPGGLLTPLDLVDLRHLCVGKMQRWLDQCANWRSLTPTSAH